MPRTRSVGWSELKLGIAAVFALVLATALILAVGGQGGFFWQRYPLRARFDDVAGLKTGAVVRLNGMEVGKVTSIEFAGAEVEVILELSRSVRHLVTSDSEASMGTLSVLGEPIIEVRAADTGTPLPDDAYLQATQGGGIVGLANAATQSLDEAGGLIADARAGQGTLGRIVTDDALYTDLAELIASASRLSKGLEEGRGSLGALAQDTAAYQALQSALENLRSITTEIESGDGALSRLLNDDAMGQSLAGASASVEQITDRLARGEGTAGRLLTNPEMYDRFNDLTLRVDRIVAELESGRGTAGQLLHDERLYENTSQAIGELRDLIADIRADPRRYLTLTFRVF
jgi:phospholipid/cholesterol/gamma-HCH transport system substrate-binding protein